MHLEVCDGVSVPVEFQDKYYASRNHKARVRKCSECSLLFYDTSPRITHGQCSVCRFRLVTYDESVPEETAEKNIGRHKECAYCLTSFLDRSHSGARTYCRRCVADFSYDVLESGRKTKSGISYSFNAKDFSEKIGGLYDGVRTDTEIAECLSITAAQVGYVRKKLLSLPSVSREALRILSGHRPLSSVTTAEMEDLVRNSGKSYAEIGADFGVKASTVEKARRRLGARPKFDIFPTLNITSLEREHVIGHVLGDGHIRLQASGLGASFKFAQKSDKKGYVRYSFDVFDGEGHISSTIDDETDGKTRDPMYGFSTVSATDFVSLYDDFYDRTLKDYPKDVDYKHPKSHVFEKLTALSMALWYQDDGSLDFGGGMINIACFFKKFDYVKMCEILSDVFKVRFDVRRNPSSAVTLLIVRGANDRERFFETIFPHVHPQMSHKLPRSLYRRHYVAFEGADPLTSVFNPEVFRDTPETEREAYLAKATDYVLGLEFPYPSWRGTPLSSLKTQISEAACKGVSLPTGKTYGLEYLDSVFRHRFTSNHHKRPSPVSAWKDPIWVREALLSVSRFNTPVTQKILRNRISSLVNAPGHFKPTVASAIIGRYGSKSVLDPMIGWGGRALAAVCCDVPKYVGIDLQEASVNGVRKVGQDFQSISRTRVYAHHGDALSLMVDMQLDFDLVIAGPPYFNTEDYNGVIPTSTYPEWVKNFVIPFCRLSYSVLRPGGTLALHIYDTSRYRFIEPFMECCQASGFHYLEQLVYGQINAAGTHRHQYVHAFRKPAR